MRQVHADHTQPENYGRGALPRSPGKAEDAATRGVGVGWHVGGNISSVVDLGEECASYHLRVPQLLVVSQCIRKGRQASRIEEASQ